MDNFTHFVRSFGIEIRRKGCSSLFAVCLNGTLLTTTKRFIEGQGLVTVLNAASYSIDETISSAHHYRYGVAVITNAGLGMNKFHLVSAWRSNEGWQTYVKWLSKYYRHPVTQPQVHFWLNVWQIKRICRYPNMYFQVDKAIGPVALGLGRPGALPAGLVQPCPKPRALIHKHMKLLGWHV